uniref:Mitochondrial inner membrane protease subunit 2 n=1 Tax=Amazona collaria TaxID=241587 RepID=A0A8B9G0Z7_9PSIT
NHGCCNPTASGFGGSHTTVNTDASEKPDLFANGSDTSQPSHATPSRPELSSRCNPCSRSPPRHAGIHLRAPHRRPRTTLPRLGLRQPHAAPGAATATNSRDRGTAGPPPRQREEKIMAQAQGLGKRYIKAFFKGFFVAVPMTVTFLDRVACVARVEGASMQPSLNPGGRQASDVVLLNHWSIRNYDVQRGDIVSLVKIHLLI